jgi:N-acyl-L-homoserine lactone synthetase
LQLTLRKGYASAIGTLGLVFLGGEQEMHGLGDRANVIEKVERLLERTTYRRADSRHEIESIRRLRYEAYLKEGAIHENEHRQLIDSFDHGDNVYNIGVYVDGQLASALRLHPLRRAEQRSPAFEAFKDVLGSEIAAGKVVLDPNRFVVNYNLARVHQYLPYVTLRPTYLASVYFHANLVTMTCRAEHQAFYMRGFEARRAAAPRPYPTLTKPLGLLLTDFDRDAQSILERHPYWNSSAAEREALFGAGPTYQIGEALPEDWVANRMSRCPSRPQHDWYRAAKMLVGIGNHAQPDALEA